MKNREFLPILTLLTLVISIPLVVIFINQSLEIRKQAFIVQGPAALTLLPATGTLEPGDDVDINLNLNTGADQQVFGFTTTLTFDKDVFEARANRVDQSAADFDFSLVCANSITEGKIRFDTAINPALGEEPVTGAGVVGTIKLRVKEGASGESHIDFVTTGSDPSSVLTYGGNKDILGTVQGGVFTIQGADTIPPDTQITAGPKEGEVLHEAAVTFTWTGTDDRTAAENLVYSGKLDKNGQTLYDWTTFVKDTTITRELATGNYTGYVKAKDEAGIEDPSPAVRNFSVDLGECNQNAARKCTAPNTCEGTQTCGSDRRWGTCETSLKNCDSNCDGKPDKCLATCSICECTAQDQPRACTTEDNFAGNQTCQNGKWGACVKTDKCVTGYVLCDDGVCLLDCGECSPTQTETCTTEDHFSGTKTCGSDRKWGICLKGANCETGYEKCPDGTCLTKCAAVTPKINLTFRLEGRTAAKTDAMRGFAREAGSKLGYDQAPFKHRSNIATDTSGRGAITGLELTGLTLGRSYEGLLKGPQHLQKNVTIANLQETNTVDFGTLLSGDITNDNAVNSMDIDLWARELWKEESPADLNGDGTVNSMDLAVLAENLLKEGDQ